MRSRQGPETALRREIETLRAQVLRYHASVERLLSSVRQTVDGVDGTKSERHRLVGALQAHADHVGALHVELGAVTAVAAKSSDIGAVKWSTRSTLRGLRLAGVTTAGLMSIGLLADIRSLTAETASEVERVASQNQEVQVNCGDIVYRIDSGELGLLRPTREAGAQAGGIGTGRRPSLEPNTESEAAKLANDTKRESRVVAAQITDDEDLLERLSSDPSLEVRTAVALRTSDQWLLYQLASDISPKVRAAVASRVADVELLRQLSADAEVAVRRSADERLGYLGADGD